MSDISQIELLNGDVYNIKDGVARSSVSAYGVCQSAANIQNKVATINDSAWQLVVGGLIHIKFSNTNTYSATTSAPVTLNVNNTGAKNIYYGASGTPTGTNTTAFGYKNYIHTYLYDGTYWVYVGRSADSNTTYSGMTATEIADGTGTTNRLISPANLKTAVETWTPTPDSTPTESSTNTVTSGGVFEAIEKKIPFGVGTALADDADLFSLPVGKYYRASAPAATMSNVPSDVTTAFYCEVVNTISTIRRKIFLYQCTAATSNVFYTCLETSTGYGTWYKFTGEAVS